MSDKSTNAPVAWSLPDVEAPAPAEAPVAKELTEAQAKRLADKGNLSTHSGTDPLGRAIGPAEDPAKVKKVRDLDGKVVTPDKDTGLTPAQVKAKAKAEEEAEEARKAIAKAREGKS